jgi:UDP-N-acetylglucosamine--N-acetylmuramyl-(pentapeptide) pyrophosphoryl-undecaprenol N-acetylglucosamine transferase
MRSNPHTSRRVVIAGGKTGGHLFPGIAVAQALLAEDPDTRILFVGTDAPFETQTLARYGFDHRTIFSRPVKGGSPLSKAWSAAIVLVSLVQALGILIRFRADVVLGVGGFSSFALVLAARMLGRRTAIQEQNACPGMTNRMLARFSHTIFIAFESTRGLPINEKTFWVGNPIRMDAPAETAETAADEPETAFLNALKPDDFLILVTGGSQGAASINQAFSEAATLLDGEKNLAIVHQTGKAQEAELQKFYKGIDLPVLAGAFFHHMPAIQERADLVVSRSGAGTLTELAVKGKAAVLIPFPYAADDHQTANARNFEEKGAALLIADKDLTGRDLYTIIQDLKAHPGKREKMETAMASLAMPHAAGTIAGHILGTRPARKGDN